MATKMKRLSLYLRTFVLLVWTLARGGDGYSCPYGQHCVFEPAPPGRAPNCALPGLTYCVHPEPYPEKIIRQLVEAGQYDIRTLLSDETRDDFSSRKNENPYGYGPNSLPHVDQISLVNEVFPNYNQKFPHNFNHNHRDIFSQKTPLQPPSPVDPAPYNINVFQASNFSKFNGFHGYQTVPGNYWNQQPNFNHYDPGYDKKVYRQNPNLGVQTGFNPNLVQNALAPSPGAQNALDPNLIQNGLGPNLGGYNPNFFNAPPTFNQNYDTTDWYRQAADGVTMYNPNEWWKYISPSRSDVTVQRSVTFPTRTTTVRRNTTALAQTRQGRKRRNAELVKASRRRQLSGAEALKIALGLASAESSAERPRRQTPNSEELCRSRTQFITPRAALNNKGSWKYVVNMPDNMTQLVKAEICASTECNGLCSVPAGYTTKCEQKYIQKRLVALESNGQNLYTDVFWIPSCCQCTIVATDVN